VSAQLALMGGRGRGGLWHLKTLVTCLGSQGTLCPCSLLMIRVGRPWNLLLLLMGPGPISLMHPARSNKSSSEGDTFPRLVCRRIAAANHGKFFLALVPSLVPPLACSCLQQWPRLRVLLPPSVHVFFCADSGLPARALAWLEAYCRQGGSWIRAGFHFFPWSPWTLLGCRDWVWFACSFSLRLPLATALFLLLGGSPRQVSAARCPGRPGRVVWARPLQGCMLLLA